MNAKIATETCVGVGPCEAGLGYEARVGVCGPVVEFAPKRGIALERVPNHDQLAQRTRTAGNLRAIYGLEWEPFEKADLHFHIPLQMADAAVAITDLVQQTST